MANQWVTHKFGGSSLADASAYRAAASNLEGSTGARRAVVVLGALGRNTGAGMTGGELYVWDPELTAKAHFADTTTARPTPVDPSRFDAAAL